MIKTLYFLVVLLALAAAPQAVRARIPYPTGSCTSFAIEPNNCTTLPCAKSGCEKLSYSRPNGTVDTRSFVGDFRQACHVQKGCNRCGEWRRAAFNQWKH
jgi:hypothetical protein